MNVLVTGGFGFIGSHLVDALVQNGHDVRVLDKQDHCYYRETGFPPFVHDSRVEIVMGDITNLGMCLEAVKGMDAVFHTAAIALVRESYDAPEKTFAVNVNGTENLLKAAVEHNVKRFIYSSTGKLYGDNKEAYSKETDALNPGTIYAKTKYQAEQIVQSYCKEHNLNVHSLRYFSIYGPHMKLFGGMIGDILKSTLNGGLSAINAFPWMERDFTYIEDVIKANILCLENPVEGFEAFNIGCGQINTIENLLQAIRKQCGDHVSVTFEELLEGTVLRTKADISKARAVLGYEPDVNLEEGLKRTIAWMRKNNLLITG